MHYVRLQVKSNNLTFIGENMKSQCCITSNTPKFISEQFHFIFFLKQYSPKYDIPAQYIFHSYTGLINVCIMFRLVNYHTALWHYNNSLTKWEAPKGQIKCSELCVKIGTQKFVHKNVYTKICTQKFVY